MTDENDSDEDSFEIEEPSQSAIEIVDSDSEADLFNSDEDIDSEAEQGDDTEFTTDDAMLVTDRLMVNSANVQSYILEYPNLPDNIRERVQRAVDELENAYQEIGEFL